MSGIFGFTLNRCDPELIEQHRLQQRFQRCVNLAMKLPMAAVTRIDGEDCAGRMYELITDHMVGLYQNGVKGSRPRASFLVDIAN